MSNNYPFALKYQDGYLTCVCNFHILEENLSTGIWNYSSNCFKNWDNDWSHLILNDCYLLLIMGEPTDEL